MPPVIKPTCTISKTNVERHVVLVAPEVHWNTGNIGRTCLGANAFLHLIRPLGFSLGSREVKRAGLDYWNKVKLSVWEDWKSFTAAMKPKQGEVAIFSKSGEQPFWNIPPSQKLYLVFGSETKGLSESLLKKFDNTTYHIPISRDIRCLNLSTSVGIALYESLRSFYPGNEWP